MDNRKDYSKYTVLIVDDIPVNIILLKTMLARTNVKILTAVNGQEALDLVRSLKPHVVLLDITFVSPLKMAILILEHNSVTSFLARDVNGTRS